MAANVIPHVRSQVCRALREYFIQNDATPQDVLPHRGIWCLLENGPRTNPLREIRSDSGTPSVDFSGNTICDVVIEDQFDGISQPGQSEPEWNRITIEEQIGKMLYLMRQSDSGVNYDKTARNITDAGRSLAVAADGSEAEQRKAATNADMADFTCLFVMDDIEGGGHPSDGAGGKDMGYYKDMHTFKITACPSKIIGYSNTEGE